MTGKLRSRQTDALQRRRRRLGEFHGETAGAQVAPELLPKQRLDVGLVVDHENEKAHARPPVLANAAALRGSTILNSVYCPGSVSTASSGASRSTCLA